MWTPHTQTDRDTIEKVQKRAANGLTLSGTAQLRNGVGATMSPPFFFPLKIFMHDTMQLVGQIATES